MRRREIPFHIALTNSQDTTDVDPITQKWWDMMADIMEVNEDNSPVSIPIEEVFHLD